MSAALPAVYLARHGETAWSLSGRHTGLTDIPLTERGERNARRLGERLAGMRFAKVFTSPLQRAARTCELAGFGASAEVDRDLVEWNYGEYEGRRTGEIRAERPDRPRSVRAPVALSRASAPRAATSSSSRAAIFCAYSPRAGSASRWPPAASSSSAPRA